MRPQSNYPKGLLSQCCSHRLRFTPIRSPLTARVWERDCVCGRWLCFIFRFGIGRFTTEEEIDYTVERTIKHVKRLREMRLVKKYNEFVNICLQGFFFLLVIFVSIYAQNSFSMNFFSSRRVENSLGCLLNFLHFSASAKFSVLV